MWKLSTNCGPVHSPLLSFGVGLGSRGGHRREGWLGCLSCELDDVDYNTIIICASESVVLGSLSDAWAHLWKTPENARPI